MGFGDTIRVTRLRLGTPERNSGDNIGPRDTRGVTGSGLGTPGHKRGDRIGFGDTRGTPGRDKSDKTLLGNPGHDRGHQDAMRGHKMALGDPRT